MVFNKDLYPKTTRVKIKDAVTLTEKIDGSNLGIFKLNGELLVALRENYFFYTEVAENPRAKELISSYAGLESWLETNKEDLKEKLYEGSGFFGEWMTHSRLAYPEEFCGGKWFLFAKARLVGDAIDSLKVERLDYNHDNFIYPFADQIIPTYVNIVPVVKKMDHVPDVEELNKIYADYREQVNRNVEGIIVIYENTIRKYVRMKRGRLEDHHE